MSIFKIEYSTDFLATKSWIASGYSPSQWRKTFEQITQKSTVSFANNFLISNNIITPIKQKNLIIRVFKYKWDQRDSNPRPRDYESPALPLRHRPVTTYLFNYHWACVSFALPSSQKTWHLVNFSSAECQQARDDIKSI